MHAFAFLLVAAASWLYFQPGASSSAGSVTTDTGEGDASVLDALVPAQDALMSIGATMRTSSAGIAAIVAREGFSAMPYQDAGDWSVGYGHFIRPGEDYSAGVTQDQALEILSADVAVAENAVNAHVSVPLTQGQFDALVSFAYNVGAAAFGNSTLLRALNAGDYQGAQEQFARWIYSVQDGVRQVNPVLQARRDAEAAQFLT